MLGMQLTTASFLRIGPIVNKGQQQQQKIISLMKKLHKHRNAMLIMLIVEVTVGPCTCRLSPFKSMQIFYLMLTIFFRNDLIPYRDYKLFKARHLVLLFPLINSKNIPSVPAIRFAKFPTQS